MKNVGVCKLALGSAQFGMQYGIANRAGQPRAENVSEILRRGEGAGIHVLDTAHAYGEAEAMLGQALAGNRRFKIVSKTLPVRRDVVTPGDMTQLNVAFRTTLDRLGSRDLYALLVHHADDLLGPGGDRLWSWMESLKSEKVVNKIGVSVYSPDQLEKAVDRYDIEIVQLPYNIYDQRFARAGLLDGLQAAGIEVHSRSVFLQGLLLLAPGQLPAQFESIRSLQARLHESLAKAAMTPLAGCLSVCLNDPRIDFVVVGCESLRQIDEIIKSAVQTHACQDLEQFALDDEVIIDPSRWTNIQ